MQMNILSRGKIGFVQLTQLLVLLLSAPAFIFGQATITGTIQGTVTDSSGAVVVGANITIRNLDTGVQNTTKSGGGGYYTVPYLPAGRYSVSAAQPGFKNELIPQVDVQVERTTRVDLTLSPGAVSETVTVSGEAPQVQSTTSDLNTEITEHQVNTLPVNGRLFQMLVFLSPGTNSAAWGDQDENPAASGAVQGGGPGNGTYAVVNGMPFQGTTFLVDGVHNVEPQNDYVSINVPFADVAEMNIETNNPSAEFGTFGGAVVNVTTKSGTNGFHGSAFDYIRNDDFNARDSFAATKAPYHANQVGGSIGGPIIKNKLFFFGDFQELLQTNGGTTTLTVPTAAMRSGNLSGLSPITNTGACATIAAANGAPGAAPCTATSVPVQDISPIAANLLNSSIIPLPNLPGTTNNFVTNALLTETAPQFDWRIDYAMSDKDRIFGRESYLHRNYNQSSPGTEFMNGGTRALNNNYNAVLSWDHTFAPTTINEARMGFNRYKTSDWVEDYGVNENNAIGLPNGNLTNPMTSGIAQFNINGFSGTGDPGPIPNGLGRLANIFEWSDDFTKIIGRQTLKFGTDVERVQTSVRNPQNDPRGQLYFTGGYTGDAFADFLVGGPSQVSRDLFLSDPATRVTFAGLFAQDDIRVTRQFTLNLGLRWDLYTAPVDAHNAQSNFVTTGSNAGLIQIASPSNPGPNVNTYYGNWEPRIGAAYSPDNGKTAIRGAFGISFFPDNFGADGGTLERNYPETLIQNNYGAQSNCNTPYAATAEYSGCGSLILANGLPGTNAGGVYAPLVFPPGGTPGSGDFVQPPPGFGVFQIAKNFRQDEAKSWNVNIQRQVTKDIVVQAAYVGTYGSHLYNDYQLNECNPPGIVATTPYPYCLPFYSLNPNITTVDFRNSGGESRYNAMQLTATKRTSYGLAFTAAYTWSKMFDNINNQVNSYDNTLHLVGAGWHTANYPQNFTLSYSYDLPFGQGKKWLSGVSGLTNAALGGWQIAGITTLRSGGALLVTENSALLPPQSSNNPPANVSGPCTNNPHTIQEWFNIGCFSAPALNTFGSGTTGDVYGPGLINWDMSLNKTIAIKERYQIRLEGNFFNIFNRTNLSNPNTSCQQTTPGAVCTNAGGFGTINGDNGLPREVQLGAKIVF